MYKLFLCLRYLRSRMIAYFAALGVALCVAMMLIAVSVMTGFLDKIEIAAKGLFGDVIVDSGGISGLGCYDEFIREVRRKIPKIEAGSPFILAYGILQIPNSDHRQLVNIAGIRLPERAEVSDFENGLFVQAGTDAPTFDPPVSLMIETVRRDIETIRRMSAEADVSGDSDEDVSDLKDRLNNAVWYHISSLDALGAAAAHQGRLARLQEQIEEARRRLYSPGTGDFQAKERQLDELQEQLIELEDVSGMRGPADRVVLGLGLPALSWQTEEGQTVRLMLPGHKISLLLAPLGGRSVDFMGVTPVRRDFTIVDDCRTDVSSIDSKFVYVPFDTIQRLNNMGPEYSADDPTQVVVPARCSQIHFKTAREFSEGEPLEAVAAEVRTLWNDFSRRNPGAASGEVYVQTWRQRQANIISNIDRQRTLVFIMFGIISLVSVVLIFVIFYMIVFQKTRDIGVLKAVGASAAGVAQIFLGWGAAVGLIGAAVGMVLGYAFVRNINAIQDWVDDAFGYRVWSKEYFLFAEIPNQVDWSAAVYIVIGAIVAGVAGALLPALRASRMQPVEALRYE